MPCYKNGFIFWKSSFKLLNRGEKVLAEPKIDFRWKEKLEEEKSRAKDMLARVEREKQLEVESSSLKYQVGLRVQQKRVLGDREGPEIIEKRP